MHSKEAERQEGLDFLYVEEATSEEGEGRRISFKTSQTVEELKRAISAELGIQREWSNLDLVANGRELHDRKCAPLKRPRVCINS